MNIKELFEKESGVIEIVPRLYIAPISVIYKPHVIKHANSIVNCTKEDYRSEVDISGKNYYSVPIDDTGRQENIDNFVIFTKDILHSVLSDYYNNKIIIVHCSQGVQRSAAFIAVLLVKIYNVSLDDAIKHIVSKKQNCFFHGRQVNFIESIKQLV